MTSNEYNNSSVLFKMWKTARSMDKIIHLTLEKGAFTLFLLKEQALKGKN